SHLARWGACTNRRRRHLSPAQPDDRGRAIADLAVASALYNNAVHNNNAAAQIGWTKARMRWRETLGAERASCSAARHWGQYLTRAAAAIAGGIACQSTGNFRNRIHS